MKIERISWSSGLELLEKIKFDSNLLKALKNIDKNYQFDFYLGNYKYGELILDKGSLILDKVIYSDYLKDLNYNQSSNPAGIIIKGALELFYEHKDRIIPYTIAKKGDLFGSWLLLDNIDNSFQPIFNWSLSAGARSVYMLPKISRNRNHDRLCKQLNISINKPTDLKEHWHIFKEIAYAKNSSWEYQVLYFPKEIIYFINSTAWKYFKSQLISIMWNNSSYMRNLVFWNSIYSIITSLIKDITFQDISTIKHLIGISIGENLGFCPATDNILIPLNDITEAYSNNYNLKELGYEVDILVPTKENLINTNSNNQIYYSLQYQTNIEYLDHNTGYQSHTKYMEHLSKMIDKVTAILPKISNSEYSPIERVLKTIEFSFSNLNSNDLILKDKRFNMTKDNFPIGNNFLRNSIIIHKANSN
ncbi:MULTISPECIES: hypothetical protein [unclassified Francisella]|uniref:hypothetical protein n=1 Tax=unclassified Francisella TaxID=2610885 RepID=UPI002E37E3E2|nr:MULTISPECIES: hypothetical protein [unclassified Francisella]MED7818895.1 hypothetical protein [Francisella sp. 19S2-4]MED7829732.1 hypothetical protein [Francisella sp. 19S2-10]